MNRDTRRTRVLLALLLVTSVSLVLIDHRGAGDSPLDGVRGVAAAVFGPVEQVAAAIAGPVSDAVDGVSSLGDDADEVDRLRKRNEELTRRLRTSALDRDRAAQLDALLHVAGAGRYRVVPAQVIAIGAAQSFSWTVTIDAGTRDGVRADMTVLDGDGLVGRVKTAGPSTATVLLAVDPDSSVGVRLEGSMEVGFTTGQGIGDDGALDLRLLDGQSTVAPGDRLVTFVPVGVVRSVQGSPGSQTRTAVVEPYVDFTALDLVGVVVEPPRSDPRDAVLPPRPTPSGPTPQPTVTVTVRPGGER
jgi:rod shape-determining protein MreC